LQSPRQTHNLRINHSACATLYGYVQNNPINFVDPFGLEYWSDVYNNFITTNNSVPGLLAPPGLSLMTSGATAEAAGSTTLLRYVASGFKGAQLGGASLTSLETATAAGGTATVNLALVSVAYEGGVLAGSLVSALPVIGTDQNITDWWVDYWWDKFHPNECP